MHFWEVDFSGLKVVFSNQYKKTRKKIRPARGGCKMIENKPATKLN